VGAKGRVEGKAKERVPDRNKEPEKKREEMRTRNSKWWKESGREK
jgi:hypothetical protein